MNKFLSTLAIFAALISTTSCATARADTDSKNITTRTLAIDKAFGSVLATSGVEITYTVNSSQSKAVITGPKNLLSSVIWKVDDDRLYFENDRLFDSSLKDVKIVLNGKALEGYEAVSTGRIIVTTPVKAGDISVVATSMGKIVFRQPVTADANLDVKVTSGAKVTFSQGVTAGSMANVAVTSSGMVGGSDLKVGSIARLAATSSGNVDFASLRCRQGKFDASSAGGLRIRQCQSVTTSLGASSSGSIAVNGILGSLSAVASSTGDIEVGGQAETANLMASSSGTVDARKLDAKKLEESASSGARINR